MTGMNMSSPTSSSTSINYKRIIEGIPAPIEFYMDLALNMKEYLEEVLGAALEEEQRVALESLEKREPEYANLGKDFKVSYKNEGFSYTVSKKSADKARSLEYGPPARSLVRHEAIVGADRISKNINKHLDKLTGHGKLT